MTAAPTNDTRDLFGLTPQELIDPADTLADRLYARARVVPTGLENRVRTVTALEGGAMRVGVGSGEEFVLSPDDETLQAFVLYTLVHQR